MNHVDNPFQSPAVLSFCAGFLGLERGIERVIGKIRVMAYVEIEAFIIANLVAGMEAGVLDSAPIWTDAKTFDARPFRGRVHGIIGGYPCPGESLAGLREGHLYKGFLWPAIRRAIAAARPLWCFFENVDDHLTGTFPIVLRSLHNMGYAVEAGVYAAEEAGAPHERQRIFILAIAEGISGRLLVRQWEKREDGFNAFRSSEKLANTSESGLQGDQLYEAPIKEFGQQGSSRSSTERGSLEWPAGQGEYQHQWEEPRTIESSLGCTIDGYNFREDLLRAYGNAVVEQQCEIAFLDLLKKHMK